LLKILHVGIILLFTYFLLKMRVVLTNRIFDRSVNNMHKVNTIKTLFLSGTRYIIYVVAVLMILSVFKINVTPMLASAGILGLAMGIGAQSLIKDILTGFFIIFEGHFHVGERIEINNQVIGTVEELGLRVTTVREWSGKKFIIGNAEIKSIRNYNRGYLRAIISIAVPFEEDLHLVFETLDQVCRYITATYADKLLKDESDSFVEPPQVFGITDINDNSRGMVFTLTAVVAPEHCTFLEREFRRLVVEYFQNAGITVSYAQFNEMLKLKGGFGR